MPTILLTPTCVDEGKRLDVYIAGAGTDLSRSQVKRLIEKSQVGMAGLHVGPATKVRAGTVIEVALPDETEPHLEAERLTVPILHQDAAILVVNKPPGLVVHPGAGQRAGTLVNQLIHQYPELLSVGDPFRPGVVHRLDKDTSGVMVVARTPAAHASLMRQFAERAVDKSYLALVEGSPPVESGVINAPVGRHPKRRTAMGVVSGGKPATTRFTVLEGAGLHTLLQITPDTGRTHQIRVHLSAAGMPVAGDPLYGRASALSALKRTFLHAHSLEFTHPTTRERVHFQAPLALDLVSVLQEIGIAWSERNGLTRHDKDPTIGNR